MENASVTDTAYPRDMVGYGRNPPDPRWPGGARIAVQFVLNYEEGGENCVLHGDAASEAFLSEITGAQPLKGVRHMNMESIYEYGSRAGFWRLWRMFGDRGLPLTVYGVAMALRAQSRGRRRDEGGRLGDREPRPALDRLPVHGPRRGAPADRRRRSASTPRSRASGRSAGTRAGPARTALELAVEEGGFLYCRRFTMPTTCPIGSTAAASDS